MLIVNHPEKLSNWEGVVSMTSVQESAQHLKLRAEGNLYTSLTSPLAWRVLFAQVTNPVSAMSFASLHTGVLSTPVKAQMKEGVRECVRGRGHSSPINSWLGTRPWDLLGFRDFWRTELGSKGLASSWSSVHKVWTYTRTGG